MKNKVIEWYQSTETTFSPSPCESRWFSPSFRIILIDRIKFRIMFKLTSLVSSYVQVKSCRSTSNHFHDLENLKMTMEEVKDVDDGYYYYKAVHFNREYLVSYSYECNVDHGGSGGSRQW